MESKEIKFDCNTCGFKTDGEKTFICLTCGMTKQDLINKSKVEIKTN